MLAKQLLLNSLFNPAALQDLLKDDGFCKKLLEEDPKILSFIIGQLSKNRGYKNAAQSFAIFLKKFTPTAEDLNELCAERSELGSKNFIALLKVMVEEKVEKDGAPAMAEMLEAVSESFREAYFQIVAKDRDLKTNFSQEFVAIFDKYIAVKPIPPQFFFSNSRKAAKSTSPSAKFSPVAALEGNPWQSSCSPSAKTNKKTIILQPSLFRGKSDEEAVKLVNQLNRLIDEGFRVFAFESGALKTLSTFGDTNSTGAFANYSLRPAAEPAAEDVKDIYALLSKQSIPRDEALVISAENVGMLEGVFFNSFNSTPNDSFLEALLCHVKRLMPSVQEHYFYLARNSISLDESQKQLFQAYVLTVIGSDKIQDIADLLSIFYGAALTNNKAFLEIITQKILEKPDAQTSQTLIRAILTHSNAISSELTIELLNKVVLDKKSTPLSENFLRHLAEYNNPKPLEFLLSKRPGIIKEKNQAGKMALRLAAQNGHKAVVEALLKVDGVYINAKDTSGFTALMVAAYNGHADVLEALLKVKVVDINAKDTAGFTALMFAAQNGHKALVEALLRKGADVNETNKDGATALIVAADNGHTDVVEALLKVDGVDINAKDTSGFTALIVAAYNGHAAMVEALLGTGANVNETNKDGATALIAVAKNGHTDVVEALLKVDGVAIDAKDTSGFTALMVAAYNGHAAMVEVLLGKGANVNETNKDGTTALIAAAKNGHKAVVEALLGKGADVNKTSSKGVTALMGAAENGHKAVVEALLKVDGVDINAKSIDEFTALMVAAQNGHKDVVEALLGKGANVNETNKDGATALIVAADNGHTDVVEALLKVKGVAIDAKSIDGFTALMVAAYNGHAAMVEALLGTGANVNEKNNVGETALRLAVQNDHADVVEILGGTNRGTNNLYLGNVTDNSIGYNTNSPTFTMSKAGEFLNLGKIKPAKKVKIKEDVFLEVKDGKLFRSKEAATAENLTSNITSLEENFNPDSLAQMRAAKDFGYVSFQLTAKAGESVKLLGLNYPFKIKALKTDRASAEITSLEIDEDGFIMCKPIKNASLNMF